MFPNAVMMKPETWNDILGDDDRGPRRARLETDDDGEEAAQHRLVGYGFMGRTHSQRLLAGRRTSSTCRTEPVLKAVCARNARTRAGVRRQVGLRVGRDRLAEAGRAQGHRR